MIKRLFDAVLLAAFALSMTFALVYVAGGIFVAVVGQTESRKEGPSTASRIAETLVSWDAYTSKLLKDVGRRFAPLSTAVRAEGGASFTPLPNVIEGQTAIDPDRSSNLNPSANAGAVLPITTPVESWGGTPRYVATDGAGTKCTVNEPCAKISDAQKAANNGDPIVVRGGVYTNTGNFWNGGSWSYETYITKPGIKLVAYPGEVPIFEGAIALTAFTNEGSYKWAAYNPLPCGNGFGVTFCTEGQYDNLNGTDSVAPYNVGKWPDQAWRDGTALQEVVKKADLAEGKFWVDRSNKRLYVMGSASGEIQASRLGDWVTCSDAPDSVISGFVVRHYSNSRARAAVFDMGPGCDRALMENVAFEDSGDMSVFLQGTNTNTLDDVTLRHITIQGSNWMGVNPLLTMRLTLDGLKISGLDRWDEFSSSPNSGAVKTSRTWYGKMLNSIIDGNKSQGAWFDESNYNWIVAGNSITNNQDSCLFWEISDKIKVINNYINCSGIPLKYAGSTGLIALNNTLIGGADVLGIYADNRSIPTCASTGTIASSGADCPGFPSNRWTIADPPRPETMDWLTRVDVIKGNIIGYPQREGYCGGTAALCIARVNGGANLALDSIIHPEDRDGGIPETAIDCNVYAVNSGSIIRHTDPSDGNSIGYDTPQAFSDAMAGSSPYPNIGGLDAHSLAGKAFVGSDGKGTANLDHSASACPFPDDPTLNDYIPAGTKHYGVTWQ